MKGFTLEYVPIEEATAPKDGAVVHMNRWWVISPDGKSLTFARFGRHRSQQCNHDERVVTMLQRSLYPDHLIQFVPVVYLPRGDD